jgi:3-oxoacyl-[acyl-carrier protein] reductase
MANDSNVSGQHSERPDPASARVALVSGGSRGLGLALVCGLLDAGWRVASFSRRKTEAIEALDAEHGPHGRFWFEELDASNHDALDAHIAQLLERFGRIDLLVNNAAVGAEGVLPTMRQVDIDRTLAINLGAVLCLTRLATRAMLRQRSGCVVNISSVNALRGHAGVSVYSATKAALDGMTRSLARELGPKGIRVNSVAPGYFDSEMVAEMSEPARDRVVRRTPLARLGSVDDVVALVLFISSSRAAFITGQTIAVDGGLTC